MEIKQTTLQDPDTVEGLLLDFDPLGFNQAKKHAAEIIPAIKELQTAYATLELKKPFDQQRFTYMIDGDEITQVINEFKNAVKKDLKVFSNPVGRLQTETTISHFAAQLHKPLAKVKEMISNFNKSHWYQLTSSDFEISGTDVILKTESLEKHYSVFLSEKGVEAYKQLHKLALCYNETVATVLEQNGLTLPLGNNLINVFFTHEVVGQGYNGDSLFGPRIEISKNHLGVFNRL